MKSAELILQRFAPLFLVFLVTGCTLGPNFEEPVVATPDVYRTPTELVYEAEDLTCGNCLTIPCW